MQTYKSGCFVCGKPLKYFEHSKTLQCEICGISFESDVTCENNHYICDSCHSKAGYEHITEFAKQSKSKNPILLAIDMMKLPFINMHGPEHHYLIVVALLVAYKNSGGKIDLNDCLLKAKQRSKNVPGGICGMWGCCGAGIGAGIFISIITEANPLSVEEWHLANLMTSQSLLDISNNGGPRCCKRNTLLSISRAIDFTNEYFNIQMEGKESIKCSFSHDNPSCKKEKCLYYNTKK